ncbi:Amine oxidase [Neofusicoccum parvum]|uniref:Amine oxidase n=1 Tax=Neofusicoccum parvum TaxID=310453 RepID=A0ACB5SIP5_9PEZI|nr:Amine oxidase [Neofusicoccum parvum]
MVAEVQMETPLAEAIQSVVQPKLAEVGWSTGGSDDTALTEYIILMLVNGKTQEQIASELASDLLNLSPDDPAPREFSRWLFEQVDALNAQINGAASAQGNAQMASAQAADVQESTEMSGMDAEMGDASGSTIPTGPKAMRNGHQNNREKRMLGHLNKAMDRTTDAALHRVRGGGGVGRVNSHGGREPPKGPRHQANRSMAIMNGLSGMQQNGMNMPGAGNMGMPGNPGQMMDAFKMYENMSAQMAQMSQMLASAGYAQPQQPFINPAFQKNQRGNGSGKSLFDRVDNSSRRNNRPQQSKRQHQPDMEMGDGGQSAANGEGTDSMDVEGKGEAKAPWDTMCKFNTYCKNAECPYAHQTPAGNPGITVDLSDECSYDVSCKNHKCTAKHHSPAKKTAFQQETPCRFGVNCKNPHCAFQHPPPPCRFGDNCKNPECKFTHLEIKCKFNPCKNPHCPYKHDEGQRAANGQEHVSERKFIDETQEEELILPGKSDVMAEVQDTQTQDVDVVTQPRRLYSRRLDSSQERQNIAILGGGITGLATAHYLTKTVRNANITVYEAGPRLGGWLQSQRVDVPGGSVLFEQGPRTIRQANSSLVTTHLVQDLDLVDEVVYTPKTAAAARNRYVYYPDHLVKMPGPGMGLFEMARTVFFEKALAGVIPAFVGEMFRPPRDSDVTDESMGSFLERRMGSRQVADNLLSAVMHGIYAGDIYQLSAKSIMPFQWYLEGKYGSVIKGIWRVQQESSGTVPITQREANFIKSFQDETPLERDFLVKLRTASVFSFRNGIQTLVNRLRDTLSDKDNVKIKTGSEITKLEKDEETGKIKIYQQEDTPPEISDLVISSVSAKALAKIATAGQSTTSPINFSPLANVPFVNVMVVNLFFSDPNVLPTSGFGYLLPRSIPFEQNPERALGVIFDSDAMSGQDTATGTKVTVMLGGHWWDGWAAEDLYSPEEGVEMARTVLARHLGIMADPTATNVSLHRDAIPQYKVGHEQRMKDAHYALKRAYGGRVRAVGNSYTGVGVNDCLRAARDMARQLGDEGIMDDKTGLEHFVEPAKWVRMGTTVNLGQRREQPKVEDENTR